MLGGLGELVKVDARVVLGALQGGYEALGGGLGSAVAEYISNKKTGPVLERVGIEDFFVKAGDYEYQLAESGLSGAQIKERVLKVYKDIV